MFVVEFKYRTFLGRVRIRLSPLQEHGTGEKEGKEETAGASASARYIPPTDSRRGQPQGQPHNAEHYAAAVAVKPYCLFDLNQRT